MQFRAQRGCSARPETGLGDIRRVTMRRGQDPFDALAEQHPDLIQRWAAEIAKPLAGIIAAKKESLK